MQCSTLLIRHFPAINQQWMFTITDTETCNIHNENEKNAAIMLCVFAYMCSGNGAYQTNRDMHVNELSVLFTQRYICVFETIERERKKKTGEYQRTYSTCIYNAYFHYFFSTFNMFYFSLFITKMCSKNNGIFALNDTHHQVNGIV